MGGCIQIRRKFRLLNLDEEVSYSNRSIRHWEVCKEVNVLCWKKTVGSSWSGRDNSRVSVYIRSELFLSSSWWLVTMLRTGRVLLMVFVGTTDCECCRSEPVTLLSRKVNIDSIDQRCRMRCHNWRLPLSYDCPTTSASLSGTARHLDFSNWPVWPTESLIFP